MCAAVIVGEQNPEYAYHLLCCALNKFGKTPIELNVEQTMVARTQAIASFEIECRALSSSVADDVVIPEWRINESVQKILVRYANEDEFVSDLQNNNLNKMLLRIALYRELKFDAVMAIVAERSPEINELDISLFYEYHRKQFICQASRACSHILVTVNPDFAENTRRKAEQLMNMILENLRKDPGQFAELARRYSECPSALQGGQLGRVLRGKLYPQLDNALFRLPEGSVSGVVETKLGLHIIYCEKIYPSKRLELADVREKIYAILRQQGHYRCQKNWLEALKI